MKYSEYELDIIKKIYPSGGCKECQKHIARSSDSIRHTAKDMGVKREKGWSELKINMKEIFDLRKPETAYILGLIWGDGTIYKQPGKSPEAGRGYCISVSLVEEDFKDIEHLFSKWKTNKHTYKNNNWKIRQTAYLSSKKAYEFLENLDYKIKSISTPTKVLAIIPEKNKHYFYRGWSDADSFIKGLLSSNYYICGSYEQDWSVLENFCRENKLLFNIKRKTQKAKNGKTYKASIFFLKKRKSILFFLDFIYKGRCFGLKRKFKNYKDYKNSFVRDHLNDYKYFPKFKKPKKSTSKRIINILNYFDEIIQNASTGNCLDRNLIPKDMRGRLADKNWNDPLFTLGVEYGVILASLEAKKKIENNKI